MLGVSDGVYDFVRVVVKNCVRKVRVPPPGEKEGLCVVHDRPLRHAMVALAAMFRNPLLVPALVDFGGPELVVEVLRNVSSNTTTRALHCTLVAAQNCSLMDASR